jgi:CBS domain-containing protein
MVVKDCGEIPVVEDTVSRLPIGVVTDRDIVCRTIADDLNPLDLTAADCMTKPIVTVTQLCRRSRTSGLEHSQYRER